MNSIALGRDEAIAVDLKDIAGTIEDEGPSPWWLELQERAHDKDAQSGDGSKRHHLTAEQLSTGIAKAGRAGRIKAWKENNDDRDFEPEEQDGSWLTCCPAHDDHTPSFVVSDATDGKGNPKLLCYCRAGCSQDKVIDTLRGLGLWDCASEEVEQPQEEADTAEEVPLKKRVRQKDSTEIVPVPEDAPPSPAAHPYLGMKSKKWDYRDEAGRLVFYVYRFEPNSTWSSNYANGNSKVPKPEGKTLRPLSYRQFEDGTTRWGWKAPSSGVPLYRTEKLAANTDVPVIVCEGEKAADAAQRLLPDHVAVTWYGGAKAVHKAPWTALANRKVTIWPDHDDAGSGACQAVANELRKVGCTDLTVLDVKALASINPDAPDGKKRKPPAKWDAADAELEWTDHDRLAKQVDLVRMQLDQRILIQVSPDNIGQTADEAEAALRNSHLPIYSRGGYIVRAGRYEEKLAGGHKQNVLIAQKLKLAGLGEQLERVICFQEYDGRMKKYKPVHAPKLLLETLIARENHSGLEKLSGVTDIPVIRRDGTLINKPGYDHRTGIFFEPTSLDFDIPLRPTRDDARDAVETIQHLIRDFPFRSKVDEAAAISAYVSAVNRPTLGPTPLYAISATTPASGKTLLSEAVTFVATGSMPNFITQGPNEEEFEKRIATQMLASRRIINIDNCNRALQGDALCNLLTAENVSLRILGRSEAPDVPSSSLIIANGNNIRVSDDMVRRTVIIHLDPEMERPEERDVGWNLKAEVRKNRAKYVSACLTIILAYIAAGSPKQTTPLGSFEFWSRRIRDAIIWLGLPDPYANAEKLRQADPDLERFTNIVAQWWEHYSDGWKKVADVVRDANDQDGENDELKLALMSVADAGRDVHPNKLAAYLSRQADRRRGGYMFESRQARSNTKEWRLVKVS